MKERKLSYIPLKYALFYIFSSIILLVSICAVIWLSFKRIKEKRKQDTQFTILALAQQSDQRDSLQTVYLAELMDLAIDKPQNIYLFDLKTAEQKLMNCSLIKQVTIKKIKPGTLYVDYLLRHPIAFLNDFSNSAIDEEGYLIPFKPFFSPKQLPEIYLGLENLGGKPAESEQSEIKEEKNQQRAQWGQIVKDKRLDLAFKIYHYFNRVSRHSAVKLKCIDVSKAFDLSYGKRQIVITLKEEGIKKEKKSLYSLLYLRLNTEQYRQCLANFQVLYRYLSTANKITTLANIAQTKMCTVIDLRIPHLAYITSQLDEEGSR